MIAKSTSVSALPQQTSRSTLRLTPVFLGPNGLRASWRIVIFAILLVILVGGFLIVRNGGVEGFREAQRHADQLVVTPWLMMKSELGALAMICLAAWIMAKIERRKFSAYGLPLRTAFRSNFWRGCLWGFTAISGTLFMIFLLRGFRITGLALHGTAIFYSLVEWAMALVLAAMVEEFLCRGYAQYTLTSGIGFWPAAFVMSGMFAFGHTFNANETLFGSISTGFFGLLFCLFLLRTGDLWLPIGFHAAWNFGQTFYGVADSGMLPYHNVLSSLSSGPVWLSGGIVGPEASLFTPFTLLLVGLIFSRYYRENRYPVPEPQSNPA